MRDQNPPAGGAVALCRGLVATPDALALYAALTDGGKRPDTLIFEQLAGPAFVLDRAAVRIECRGGDVTLRALSANGRNLLEMVAQRMPERLVEFDPDRLLLRFPPVEGVDSEERLKAASPFDVLREVTVKLGLANDDEPYGLLCLGTIAFDHVDLFERLPSAAEDPLDFPDFLFWVAESLVVFDPGSTPRAISTAFGASGSPEARTAYFEASTRLAALVERCEAVTPRKAPLARPNEANFTDVDLDDEEYAEIVRGMKRHIAEGEVYQIVASRTFRAPCPRPFDAYATLRKADPSPYCFFFSAEDFQLFGASPETSVRVFLDNSQHHVEVKPIAGTRARGATPDEDDRLEAELRLDHKEQAEHMMLVDLARNDVARISVPGSRRVSQLMNVERYARVMHLVSSVIGKLRPGDDALDALKACLNMGTLTGAPKIRATELLRQAERTKRGPYGGTIGWISGDGQMDSAIVIRSAIVKGGTAFVRAGAGIVHDSDPAAEALETKRKAQALLTVLAGASA